MALEAANPAFDVSQASLAQRCKVPRFRLRLGTIPWVGEGGSECPWCLTEWPSRRTEGERAGELSVGPGGAGVEPQAPEIRDAGRWAPDCLCFCDRLPVERRGLALMISPVDVSTSVCLSREADDSLCKHPAL